MEHVNGEMNVNLLDHTKDAARVLVFSKRTRHSVNAASYEEAMNMSEDELKNELKYVFSTIGSSWEFVDYTFLITGVTRAFTHQLVRHRVGVAFAQQAMRVGEQLDFGYMVPTDFCFDFDSENAKSNENPEDRRKQLLYGSYVNCMDSIQSHYVELIENNARPQDARGVLPTNILTNILFKVNLRALADIMNVRLCLRAQGEFQEVARKMQQLVLGVHPWAAQILGPNCLVHSVCKFPRYTECPISQKHPQLRGLPEDTKNAIRSDWEGLVGYDPQPVANDWDLSR